MKRNFLTLATILVTLTCAPQAYSLPIDWNGVFGVDTTLIDNYRKVEGDTTNNTGTGSAETPLGPNNKESASFQTYIFRLNPVMIVNDSATLKAEITSGYARGGRFGDSPKQNQEGNFGNALYLYNVADEDNTLSLNKFYAELYSDTATYIIGRHSSHWGLGAVQNSGEGSWDRHAFVRDGITMKLKLGNFELSPYWAKLGLQNSLTRSSRAREYGASLLYDNIERDLSFGILYSKKSTNAFSKAYAQNLDGGGVEYVAPSSVTLIDLYFRKAFGDFKFEVEVPFLSDDIGDLYGTGSAAEYKARAFLFESEYQLNNSWTFGLDAGQVSGDDGKQGNFEAMYLNPNYQIANVLFRYNLRAMNDPQNLNVYDSYITNAMYLKLRTSFQTGKWLFNGALIYAKANEVATNGQLAFDHLRNKTFTANADQSDDLGIELDLDFDYQWNNEVSVGGSMGYLMAGDYYKFTNTSSPNNADDSLLLQLRTTIDF